MVLPMGEAYGPPLRREGAEGATAADKEVYGTGSKYKKEYGRMMYLYFTGYGESVGAPSFSKFARSIGITLEDLKSFRKKREFDAAWRECSEIRRDYLIDMALSKRADASFTKFIYAIEYPEITADNEMHISLSVVDEAVGGI